jgi:hypothetical protein
MRTARKQWFPEHNVLETELGNGWMVVERFEIHDGRRVVAELRIFPAPRRRRAVEVRDARLPGERPPDAPVPSGGITARLLRHVKVGQHAEPVSQDYRTWVKKHFGRAALQRLDGHVGPVRRARRRRTKRRTQDRFYAELARDYASLWEKGTRTPTATLARLRGVPLEAMRSHVHLARTNGWLTDTSRGRAGGAMTQKTMDLLAASQ